MKDIIGKIQRGIAKSKIGRSAKALALIENDADEFFIYKPWGIILKILSIHFVRFYILTLISCTSVAVAAFTVGLWVIFVYDFVITLKLMKKYNISTVKIIIYFIIFEVLFVISSPYVLNIFWQLFSRLITPKF